jgi:sec-independent protein translocase protein TatA
MRLGIPELFIILAIVILIFGASRLPALGRGIGRGIRNFKDATRDGGTKDD